MKIVTLLENTARRPGLAAARGLSLYVETDRRKVLFDMGPDASFLDNARALGIDLAAVDAAVLSHGHSDHGGGLAAFCAVNRGASIYLRREALGRSRTTSACRRRRGWRSALSSPGSGRRWTAG